MESGLSKVDNPYAKVFPAEILLEVSIFTSTALFNLNGGSNSLAGVIGVAGMVSGSRVVGKVLQAKVASIVELV